MDPKYADCVRLARTMIDPDFVRSLRAPRITGVMLASVLIWAQLAISWSFALLGPLWLIWIPFVINCAVIQAMLLWTHEASHFSLFASRRLNDIWCDVLFAGPVGLSVAAYRSRHMTHHVHLGTDHDEDGYTYRYPVKGFWALLTLLGKVLTGGTGIWLAASKYFAPTAGKPADAVAGAGPRWVAPVTTILFNSVLLALCVWSGRWFLYLAVWAYPILAVAIALNVVRTIAEHQPEDYSASAGSAAAMDPIVRTTLPSWFEKWVLYQANFNYHVEHHMFPLIPQHNLKLLHRRLVERGFYRQFPGALQRSGFGKFVELAHQRTHNDFSDATDDAVRPS